MRAFMIISLALAALFASPIAARPSPNTLSPYRSDFNVDGRPLRVLPNYRPWRSRAQPRIREEYGGREAVDRTAHAPLRMHYFEARELAQLVMRAMEEGEELYTRRFEELERRNMPKGTKKKLEGVLDKLKDREPSFTWDLKWTKAHDAYTSQLDGYKPGSRMDSTEPPKYHVGIFETSGKKLKDTPVIQASFNAMPGSMANVVAALRTALAEA